MKRKLLTRQVISFFMAIWLSNVGEDKLQEIISNLEVPAWGVVMVRME